MKAIAIKAKSKPATGNMIPPGVGDKRAGAKESMTMGAEKSKAMKEIKVAVWEVWLCDEPETEGKKPRKIRKLHEATGPTAKQTAEEFVKLWSPEVQVQPPPQCPADGKKLKPNLNPEIQPCLL